MKNESQAGANADSSATDEVTPSASLAQNPLLAEAFSVRPILFKGEMVQAILEGHKTQTRGIVKGTPEFVSNPENSMCPYGKIGDVLWVKETWQEWKHDKKNSTYYFKATDAEKFLKTMKWKPSIFMPKYACRLFLKITDIKVQQLNDISNWEWAISFQKCERPKGFC